MDTIASAFDENFYILIPDINFNNEDIFLELYKYLYSFGKTEERGYKLSYFYNQIDDGENLVFSSSNLTIEPLNGGKRLHSDMGVAIYSYLLREIDSKIYKITETQLRKIIFMKELSDRPVSYYINQMLLNNQLEVYRRKLK